MPRIKNVLKDSGFQMYVIITTGFSLGLLFLITSKGMENESGVTVVVGTLTLLLYTGPAVIWFVDQSRVTASAATVAFGFAWAYLARDWSGSPPWLVGSILTALVIGTIFSLGYGIFWRELTS